MPKIFEFEFFKEKDWVIANDINEASEYYIGETSCGDLEGFNVKEIPKEEWDSFYILDIDEQEPDPDEVDYNEDDYCDGYKIQETFAEYAEGYKHPEIIATTNY